MARDDESWSDSENEVIENFTLDELHDTFDDLHEEFQKLSTKYVALKKILNALGAKLNDLSKEKKALFEENLLLKREVEKFFSIAYKLTSGKENLEKLLGSQKQFLSKHGLGYIS